ncbi:MAG TPA: class I adenylate-forming enzyme family protein [Symbiobacteriaceae bacterium]|nr:class I adenylate-forming enzyme family protein [Symbiobacteriaceae bacterium]
MRVSEGLWRRAEQEPARTALVTGMQRWTYRDLQAQVARFGADLYSRGLRRGERIAICLPNSAEYLISFMAAARYGWVAVTIAESVSDAELAKLLSCVRAGAVVATSDWIRTKQGVLDRMARQPIGIACDRDGAGFHGTEPPLAEPSDPFYIGFTSGSTGRPKGVVRRHADWVRSFAAATAAFGLTPDEKLLVPGPLHFSASLFAAVHILETGGCLYLERRFNPRRVAVLTAGQGITGVFMVPTLYQSLIEESRSMAAAGSAGRLRCLISCGEKLRPSLRAELQRLFPGARIYEYYGSSEIGFMTVMPPERSDKPHSVGIPFPGVELSIKQADGSPAPPGTAGILHARSSMMAAGYDSDGGSIAPFTDHDGWACTGDLAHIDGDGLVYVEGRADDAINSGGALVFPAEVEAVLAGHPAVAEVAVFGRPNTVRGEEIVAAVVLKAGAHVSKAELRVTCANGLAQYKRPRVFAFLPALPRTETGKVSRRMMREQLADSPSD